MCEVETRVFLPKSLCRAPVSAKAMELLDNIIYGSAGYSPGNSSVCHLGTTEIKPSIVIYIPEPGKLSLWHSNLDLWASAGQKTVGYQS